MFNYYVRYSAASIGQRFIPLLDGSKIPDTSLAPRGHLDGVKLYEFPSVSWEKCQNYGLVLDGQYIVVDFDAEHPERDALEKKLPRTWTQQTRKGKHYLYTVPANFKGKNAKLRASDGTILGDLKSLGYIVCPDSIVDGHTYERVVEADPAEAPEWLLRQLDTVQKETHASDNAFDILPDGARDSSLHRIASNLRAVGYSQMAIEAALGLLVSGGLVEQPEGREIEDKDIARLARSASKYMTETSYDSSVLIPANYINGADVTLVGPPTSWWLYGFVPKGELVTMFGKGGIGKSTFASWLCAKITREGGTFGVLAVEEPFARFVARAVLCGADRTKIYGVPNASQVTFPHSSELLRTSLEQLKLDALFFDSIYTHFDSLPGLNMAERSRMALSSLAEIAQTLGVTIIGNFHENKMGNYLGSVEMENVARVMLKMTRKKNKPLRVHVEKTNKRSPDYDLEFPGVEKIICEPLTGEVQMETNEAGILSPEKIIIAQDPVKILFEDEEEEVQQSSGFVNIGDLAESKEERDSRVLTYHLLNPAATQRDIADALSLSLGLVNKILNK